MPQTIATLLTKLKIQHSLDPNSPLLSLPLSLFKQEVYPELISIVWLYSDKWIKKSALKAGMVLGEHSAKQIKSFYETIYDQVVDIIKSSRLSNVKPKNESPHCISSNPGKWVTPTLVTLYVRDRPMYQLLDKASQCALELNHFLLWLDEKTVSAEDQTYFAQYMEDLEEEGTREASINRIVDLLRQIESFKSGESPQANIYLCISRLNKEIASHHNNQHNPQALAYFHEVLTRLSRKYPTTLESLLISMDFDFPEKVNADLIRLLRIDLRTIPGLTEEQWPQLAFYVTLFLHGLAKADPKLMYFSYAGEAMPAALSQVAERYTTAMKKCIEKPERCTPELTLSFEDGLPADLAQKGLQMHPRLLALMCFENCPALRNLLLEVWIQRDVEVPLGKTKALIPSPNRFLLGLIHSVGPAGEPIGISNHDLRILVKLHELFKQKDFPKTDKVSLVRQRSSVLNSDNTFFSPSSLLDEPLLTGPKSALAQFKSLQKSIKDPLLREATTHAHIAAHSERFLKYTMLNYDALIEFFATYEVNAKQRKPVDFRELEDFLAAVPDVNALDMLVKEMSRNKAFLDLSSSKTLIEQRKTFIHTIRSLKDTIKAREKDPSDEKQALRKKWFETQLYIYDQFLNKVEVKLAKLKRAESRLDQSIDKFKQEEDRLSSLAWRYS